MYTGKCASCGEVKKDCQRGYCGDCRQAYSERLISRATEKDATQAAREAIERDEWRGDDATETQH